MGTTIGQTHEDEWIFGYNNHVSFATGTATSVGWGPVYTEEGSSSISDKNGALLFSVQGNNVFDKNGTPMAGGSDLKGSTSSTQNSLIVPFPGDEDDRFFHVFTVSAQNDYWLPIKHTGLEHAVVDMQANSGLGEVIAPPQELIPFVAEKIHATWHANQRDVWVVTHLMGSNGFYALPITCEGLGEPVFSYTGISHLTIAESISAQGALKISPNGQRIACTHTPADPVNFGRPETYLEIGTFNNVSGQVEITDTIIKTHPSWQGAMGYGVEFSPNSNLLYWSIEKASSDLYQYDVSAANIAASEYLVSTENPSVASLQLAPNGKIYVSRLSGSTQLHVIDNPDGVGAASQYSFNGPTINGYLTHGLPSNWMFPYPDPQPKLDYDTLEICKGHVEVLHANDSLGSRLIWNTGSTQASETINHPGIYWVTQSACPFDTSYFVVEESEDCICDVYLPNAMTPDADGINDLFVPLSDCELIDFHMTIYDRWGNIVFESHNISNAWDGTTKNGTFKTDVYVWRLSWKAYDDGVLKDQTKLGHVTVLR